MKDDKERLKGIIRACDKIGEYIAGMTYDDFIEDEKTTDACAAKSSVIGNFCNEISEHTKALHPEVDWHGAYRFRCRVDHSYDTPSFDLSIMWDTLTDSIPKLRDDCVIILRELELSSESPRSKGRKSGLGRRRTGFRLFRR